MLASGRRMAPEEREGAAKRPHSCPLKRAFCAFQASQQNFFVETSFKIKGLLAVQALLA